MVRIVVATRLEEAEFRQKSLLSGSLRRISAIGQVWIDLSASNRRGLSEVYNAAIEDADGEDTLLFIHDDVWIDDWLLVQRLEDALKCFDVVGVAGDRQRRPKQGTWFPSTVSEASDPRQLTGAVSHGKAIDYYGPTPAAARLMDGLFLAAKAETLQTAKVRFDPIFAFHLYDLDFCRSCEQAGLSMGTWPIALTHGSRGDTSRPEWKVGYDRYLAKWKE